MNEVSSVVFGAWAKLTRDPMTGAVTSWHSLPGHATDVAAVFYQLLVQNAVVRQRLETLAGRSLTDRDVQRLSAIAFLHDLGKANAGFRARGLTDSEQKRSKVGKQGHLHEVGPLFGNPELAAKAARILPVERLVAWCGSEQQTNEYLAAMLAHHGRPLNVGDMHTEGWHWRKQGGYDPLIALGELADALQTALPGAFSIGGEALAAGPPFIHAFCGLLQLADWIGSDEKRFAFDQGSWQGRWPHSLETAHETLKAIGLGPMEQRKESGATRPSFPMLFTAQGRPLEPTPLQVEAAISDRRSIVLIESETGSGKTEAALWRFATLFASGDVDSLFFALPTRVSASLMYKRVLDFARKLFGDDRPGVVLAVPGQVQLDGQSLAPLASEPIAWSDIDADAKSSLRWAAERPKRFLAARIAVGTIDQALLSSLQTKHAHLRHVCLMRSLLVVDEAHASDTYMSLLLERLLANHARTGGHALLMSATLGASARTRLLSPGQRKQPENLAAASAKAYPAVSWSNGRMKVASNGAAKPVTPRTAPCMDTPETIAGHVASAVTAGAKVLVIRNTVRAAQETLKAVEARLGSDHPALFRSNGVASLHHGRFARADREQLDWAVEHVLGKNRKVGDVPAVVIGTQTLEQSLDIDADLLITDLCPVDVLLQRIGRLHRHERGRPNGYEDAQAIVLVPEDRDLLNARGRNGLGLSRGPDAAGIYEDLLAIEATWRLLVERPLWLIPEMNRKLVEPATHPEAIATLLAELTLTDRTWNEVHQQILGRRFAQAGAARDGALDFAGTFSEMVFPDLDEKILTRLGVADRRLLLPRAMPSPFGQIVEELTVPGHWKIARALQPDGQADSVEPIEGGFDVRIGNGWLTYDRFGLRSRETAIPA